jgi:hypothetical protein
MNIVNSDPDAARALREQRIRHLYALSDAWEADRLTEVLAVGVRFRFGNAPATDGIEPIRQLTRATRTIIARIEHRVSRVINGESGYATAEIDMLYVRNDGRRLEVPAAVVFHFDSEQMIDEYRIYMDGGDFFA